MKITSMNMKLTTTEAPVVAYCSIVFDNCFIVRKIRLLERNGTFHTYMPSMKSKNGVYADVCHPINSEFRRKIEEATLEHYHSLIKGLIK